MPEVMEIYRMAGDVDYLLRSRCTTWPPSTPFYKRLIAAAH